MESKIIIEKLEEIITNLKVHQVFISITKLRELINSLGK